MQIKQFYPYSPRKADFEQLSYSFVARESLLEELIASIREQADAEALQHWMILGMRGMGKSHLIALVYQTVKNSADLNQRWIPLMMHEEEQSVFSLHTLFIRFLTQLAEEIADTDKKKSEAIFDFLDMQRNRNKTQEEILESVVAFLKDFVRETGKRLLVFMENSDDIFSRSISKKNDIKKFRNILQHDKFMLLIATSPTFFDRISKPSAPLYQFFRIRSLELLKYEQSVDLMNRWRKSDIQLSEKNSRSIKFDKDDYKLLALHHLTGGNPRVLLFLYMAIKGQDGIQSAVETFSKLLEEDLSNYYLSRLRDLSNQVQPIILALAESDKNLTQKEISQKTFLPMKSIGTAMLRLEKESLIRPVTEKKGKNTLYTLTDSLFRLWHQWRISAYNKEIIKAVVMCVAVWYKKEELEQWSINDDIVGMHCKEALQYRRTEHFKSLWEPLYKDSETMIIRYLEKEDYQGLDKKPAMLQKTGIEPGKLLKKIVGELEGKGDMDNALKIAEKRLENNKEDKDAWVDLARLRFNQENYAGAEAAFEKAVELDPKDAEAWTLLGVARGNQENHAGAEAALEKAVELDPKDAEAWKWLGGARNNQKNYAGAEVAFEKAVELDPKDAEAWKWLGHARGNQENHAGAEAAFEKAVELDPKDAEAWKWLGGARNNQKNYAGAEEAFEKAVELDPKDAEAWKWLGYARNNQENHAGAEEAFEKAVELDPKDAEAWKWLGGARGNQENYAGAEEAFEKAVELDPKDAEAWKWLGDARDDQENYAGAEEAFEKAVELDPKDAEAWKWLGGARYNQENYAGAEEAFEKAVELDPKDAWAWKWLGYARGNQENHAGAEAALEKAVELDPKDAWAWIFLGGARGNQKNNAGAETAFHKHIIINPFEKEVYGDLLEVLVNDDRVPDILPILDNALSLKDAEIDFKTVIHFIRAFAFLYQQDRTPFIKDLNDATEYLEELVEEKKHEVLGMVMDLLTDTLQKKNIRVHRTYVAELRNISTELSGVFRPMDHVLDYFEVIFSAEKDKKAKTNKARRIIDSITDEIRGPVEKMIEKIKGHL
jgi:tetratricopeptide (TPR) repeat protein